jgi:hypothetical protein
LALTGGRVLSQFKQLDGGSADDPVSRTDGVELWRHGILDARFRWHDDA